MIHTCPDCGLVHDHVAPPVSPEVEIARINAENALRIAQLQARADRHIAEVEAQADVDVAETTAEAIVEAVTMPEAEEQAEPVEADPEPVIVAQVDTDVEQPDVPPPPAEPEHEEHHESKPKKRGLGMWGA